MEGVVEPTAAPHAILGVQGHAAAASPRLWLDHQHLAWGPDTSQSGPGRARRWGPSLRLSWDPPPFLIPCGVCHFTWPTPTPSSSFLRSLVCPVLFKVCGLVSLNRRGHP